MNDKYSITYEQMRDIMCIPRDILGVSPTQSIPFKNTPTMMRQALSKTASTALYEGQAQGKLSLIQNTESLQATAIGTSLILDDISPIEHELDIKVIPKNYFDINKVNNKTDSANTVVTNNNDGTLTIVLPTGHGGGANGYVKLGVLAPELQVGEKYTLSFTSINPDTGANSKSQFIYLASPVNTTWNNGVSRTITENDLNANVVWYASGGGSTALISDIKIQKTAYVNTLPTVNIYVSDNELFENSNYFESKVDGTFDTINSIYPNTYISSDISDEDIELRCNYIKDIDKVVSNGVSQGQQQAYDEFWNAYQSRGTRTNYRNGFGGIGWTDNTLKPKYPILPAVTDAYMMFAAARVQDIATIFPSITVSGTSQYMFYNNYTVTHIGEISLNDEMNGTFQGCSGLVTIDKLIINYANTSGKAHSSTFSTCSSLKNIVIEGEIKGNLSVSASTKLSKNSLISSINALSTESTGKTFTLSTTAVNNAFETSTGANDGSTSEEWLTLTGTRTNWTIAIS